MLQTQHLFAILSEKLFGKFIENKERNLDSWN